MEVMPFIILLFSLYVVAGGIRIVGNLVGKPGTNTGLLAFGTLIAEGKPAAKFVHAFPSGPSEHDMCAVPVVYGKYWIQTVGAINGLVVLDTSDPDRPVEVSRLVLPKALHVPHWAAADRGNGRIVVTGMHDSWVALLKFDEATGRRVAKYAMSLSYDASRNVASLKMLIPLREGAWRANVSDSWLSRSLVSVM